MWSVPMSRTSNGNFAKRSKSKHGDKKGIRQTRPENARDFKPSTEPTEATNSLYPTCHPKRQRTVP